MAIKASEQEKQSAGSAVERAIVSFGDVGRLERVFSQARAGLPITVAGIGGSVTGGAAASGPGRFYLSLVADWWRKTFPRSKVRLVNGGIGATELDYGALRAQRDLLSHDPDFIIVEFAVNDSWDETRLESYEGLVRKLLAHPRSPAVLLLFFMNEVGTGAEPQQRQVGAHYQLPMVSIRSGLWPDIERGRWSVRDFLADSVHPNDRGHAFAAECIRHLLDRVLEGLRGTNARAFGLPNPLTPNAYETACLLRFSELIPLECRGWVFDKSRNAWSAKQPGARICFRLEGRTLFLLHHLENGPWGQARVTVDTNAPQVVDGWFSETWGGRLAVRELARGLEAGAHHVCLEVLETRHPDSSGHGFTILGLGAGS